MERARLGAREVALQDRSAKPALPPDRRGENRHECGPRRPESVRCARRVWQLDTPPAHSAEAISTPGNELGFSPQWHMPCIIPLPHAVRDL